MIRPACPSVFVPAGLLRGRGWSGPHNGTGDDGVMCDFLVPGFLVPGFLVPRAAGRTSGGEARGATVNRGLP